MTIEELESTVIELQNSINILKNSVATLTTQIEQITRMHGLLDFNLDDNSSSLKHGDIIQYDNFTGKWNNIQPTQLNIKTDNDIIKISLKDLNDVNLNTEINGHVLTYSSADEAWVNKEPYKNPQIDMSGYLTLEDADKRYLKLTGGTITGNVSINGALHVSGNVTSEQAITAKAIA